MYWQTASTSASVPEKIPRMTYQNPSLRKIYFSNHSPGAKKCLERSSLIKVGLTLLSVQTCRLVSKIRSPLRSAWRRKNWQVIAQIIWISLQQISKAQFGRFHSPLTTTLNGTTYSTLLLNTTDYHYQPTSNWPQKKNHFRRRGQIIVGWTLKHCSLF